MKKIHIKKGFSLAETVTVIAVLGCLFVLAIGMFNVFAIQKDTIALRQSKIESALKTATMSIVSEDKLTASQACTPTVIRDKYAEKLQNAEITDDLTVNGKKLPAIAVGTYGVLAFDATTNCANNWNSTLKTGSIQYGNDLTGGVVIYSVLDNETNEVNVPASVAGGAVYNSSTLSTTEANLTENTMAFAVNAAGITNTYSTIASASTKVGDVASINVTNNDKSACQAGEDYSYVSSVCKDKSGNNLDVKFYEMLNASDCSLTYCPGNGYDNSGKLITTGQVNLLCKLGTGNVGQCACPEGKSYWSKIYVTDNSSISGICLESCDELGMVESSPGSKTCVCPDGTTWSQVLKQCIAPGTCPEDWLTWDEDSQSCICKSEADLIDMDPNYFAVCEIYDKTQTEDGCKRLRDNWDKSTGTCVCPTPFTVQNTHDCVCLSPRTQTGDVCECDRDKTQLTNEEIFDATKETCKFDCSTISKIANKDRTECIEPCGCLKKYDRTTGTCVCDSSQASSKECINDDEKFDATSLTCKSCKYENHVYDQNGVCVCKEASQMTFATNEIYDATSNNCKYVCKDGAVSDTAHAECIGDCLEQYNYTTEKLECIPNPTDEQTTACLKNTNYISSPSSATCKVECSTLTSPNSVHKQCPCDEAKVAVALEQQGNLNKIYDLDNAPTCMAACTGQTFPQTDRLSCRPVDCLYETTDNVTQHCIPNPTDAKTTECLKNTNYVSNPSAATCQEECGTNRSPNNVYKICECDLSKTKLVNEEIFDITKQTCKFDCSTIGRVANSDRTECIIACGCLKKYDSATDTCVCDPTQSGRTECINADEKFDATSSTCKSCKYENQEYNTQGTCVCKSISKISFATNEIYDTTSTSCKYICKDGAVSDTSHTECIGGCLEQYNYNTEQLECIPNPTDEQTTACLKNTNYISNPSNATCKEECGTNRSPNSVYKICECDLNKTSLTGEEIFDVTKQTCKFDCATIGKIANMDRTACIEGCGCLKKYDRTTGTCVCDPSQASSTSCIRADEKFDASSSTCKVCRYENHEYNSYGACVCKSISQISFAANEIYDTTATNCKYACKDGAISDDSRTECIGDCLEQYNYNTEKLECIPNPTDAQTTSCLKNTNYISKPSASTCRVECTGLTSPNSVHKQCPCDTTKVATALNKTENLNKIYDLNNAPTCIKACTGQTFPDTDRLSCRPVDCLYETTDNVTQHCIPNPTDAQTTACLANTNYISNPSYATCKEDCGLKRVPNNVYKVCECSLKKMENQYSSYNYKFDATAAGCESRCPSDFTFRNPQDPTTCVCPAVQPAAVTVQPGYYYDATSSTLSGTHACQLNCPTTRVAILDWIDIHSPSFTTNKIIYDSTKAGCLGSCSGNYIASSDKLSCICGIGASSCQAGTYYSASTCSCEPCTVGHYCPGGTDTPIECPCGTYGATTGLKTIACSGQCQEGYYCPQGSTSKTQIQCSAGYKCPSGSCSPVACDFPSTSVSPYTSCSKCRSESEIRATQPGYFGQNEVYVDSIQLQCKKCKSNMEYNAQGVCTCPASKPNWDGTQCIACKVWKTLYFARQSENRPSCTLYDHMLGNKGACFDYQRIPSQGMIDAANKLSSADKNRTFNGIYAYMVAVANDGTVSVVGVFTSRSWYHTFPTDYSSVNTARSQQVGGDCSTVCGGNTECISTCNYMKGKVKTNTMFNNCHYAVNNQYLGNKYNNASDELCTDGAITLTDGCSYIVGGILRNVTSPLVLDLKGNGFKYTSVEDGVVFDLNNDGVPEKTAWTAKQRSFDNAFLVLDKNKNGQVDNGGELFGDQNGADNGFLELAKYDTNGDKVINEKDKVYNELLLWVDFNKNAKVDYEADGSTKELKTLKEAGVTELSVDYKITKDSNGNILRDMYGNITGFIGSFKMAVKDAAGKLVEVVRSMMDVFFVTQ